MKIKKTLSLLTIFILSIIILFFLYINSVALGVLFSPTNTNFEKDKWTLEQYELLKWKYETELQYSDKYCNIQKILPQEDSLIGVNIYYHTKPLEISSTLNPYPNYTTIYEMGRVESSNSDEIETENSQMMLYRIQLIEDHATYIEYISNRNNPYLYLVKDDNSSQFLIYPILFGTISDIDSQYYIETL